MNTFTETEFHEAGHAALWLIEEQHLGPLKLVTAIPSARHAGLTLGDKTREVDERNPEVLRAWGRVLVAGPLAAMLAGGKAAPSPNSTDLAKLATLADLSGRRSRFVKEATAGAEYQLRAHWGAVEGIVKLMRALGGELTAPYGIDLARMELKQSQRQLGLNSKTLMRLLGALEQVPEIADPMRAELGITRKRRANPKRRETKPTAAAIDARLAKLGFEVSGGVSRQQKSDIQGL